MDTLPLILPSVTGVAGVVHYDAHTISVQCQECGLIRSKLQTVRYDILLGAGIHHHQPPWPDGTNPRLCRDCRLARDCRCAWCDAERHGTPQAWTHLPWRWEGIQPPSD